MTSTTTALLQNLATLRATRDAIMAEIDALNSAPAEVEPCGVCGNDFADTNCSCELPESAAYDW
jgi:tRNA U54 and U55 pseudouridine synthase Pus10